MDLVKLGSGRYLNLERVTHVEQDKKGRVIVHFAVGGGDVGGPACSTRLQGPEAEALLKLLDARIQRGEG